MYCGGVTPSAALGVNILRRLLEGGGAVEWQGGV